MGRREEGGGSCWQADGCECRVLIKSHLGTMAFSYSEPALHKAQLVRREDSPLPFFSSSYSFPRVCGNVWHPAQPTGVSFNQKTCQVSLLLDCLTATCRHQKGQLQEARPLQPMASRASGCFPTQLPSPQKHTGHLQRPNTHVLLKLHGMYHTQ